MQKQIDEIVEYALNSRRFYTVPEIVTDELFVVCMQV